jgi:hypothetical protein
MELVSYGLDCSGSWKGTVARSVIIIIIIIINLPCSIKCGKCLPAPQQRIFLVH